MSTSPAPLHHRVPRIAEAALQRARLSVVPRPRLRSRAPRVPFVTLVSVLLLAGVVGLLLFNTSMQQASFRESALQRQAKDLSAREDALSMELQGLRDPQRIAEQARSQGMVLPQGPAGVLPLGGDGVIGDPMAAADVDQPPLRLPDAHRPGAFDPKPVKSDGAPAADRTGDRPRLERER